MTSKYQKGFTLIELSIVLVILGVIVGGVLTGQTLIKSAEMNSFISDIERFKSAFARFQTQYEQLPGDMDNAYDYWGSDCGDSAANCNGDGDAVASAEDNEGIVFWNHLYVSGLLDDYSQQITDPGENCTFGKNIPYTAIDGVSMIPHTDLLEAKSLSISNVDQLFVFSLVYEGSDSTDCVEGNDVFSAEQLYTIDKKIDDGFAYSGKVLNSQNDTGCTTSSNTGTGDLDNGDYDLANNGQNLCKLFVKVRVD